MRLPRYKEYKDSGAEWLGAVPKHWVIAPIKAFGRLKGGAGFPHNEQGIQGQELEFFKVNSLAAADVKGLLQRGEHTISRDTAARLGAFVFPVQSIVFAKVGAALMLGRVRELAKPACIDNNMMGLIVSKGNDVKFVRYAMNLVRFDLIANPGAVPSLNESQIGNFVLTKPPLAEQTAIATFLDLETAKIDTLIAEQEKLIALLAEKRQATISHAITKGIITNVPMKDSGVAWLGEVPAHWEVVRIKRVISSIEQGWSPQCENFPIASADEWGVLKVGCVNGGVFRPSENKKLPLELEPVPAYSLKRGDVLISRANTRELVGSAAAVETDFDNLMLCDKLYRLRLDKARCTPSYLAAYLGTPQARSQIELAATGASSSMLNIGQSAILDLPAPMPSVTEQNEIQEFLRTETLRLDALNAVAERAIILLKERRNALIAATVTGQIDVRGAMPQASIENLEAIAA